MVSLQCLLTDLRYPMAVPIEHWLCSADVWHFYTKSLQIPVASFQPFGDIEFHPVSFVGFLSGIGAIKVAVAV